MKRFLALALSLVLAIGTIGLTGYAQQIPGNPSPLSHVGGLFYASAYSTWHSVILSGNSTTGAVSIVVSPPTPMLDGTAIPVQVAWSSVYLTAPLVNDANIETATAMTAISFAACPAGNLGIGGSPLCATLSGNFASTHGQGALVQDGTFGLTSAAAAAVAAGGGQVVVDAAWTALGGTNAMISALAVVYPTLTILDVRSGAPRNWLPTPSGLALAAPTGVPVTGQAACDATHQACSDATVAGVAGYAGGALHTCEAYVDIMGNEGPCSADATWTDVSAKAIDMGLPAASAGAVGFVVYLSLDAGTYAQAYQVPATSTICTLTTLETVTPACAVTNATYGQTGSIFGKAGLFNGGAQITALSLNTGLHFTKLASTVQTTASLTPMTNSSVTYTYAPSNRTGGCPGISSWNQTQEIAAGGISASSTTGIPMSMGTWTIPANCFNFVGAEFRVSGKITWTDGGAADAMKVIVAWDSPLTNTTTVPTTLCNIANTHTNAAAAQTGWYSCTVKILTTGTGGTALVNGTGFFDIATGAAGVLIGTANDTAVAASAAINLTVPARIAVRFSDTGATVTGAQPLEAALEVLN
jgi:hypothetical protein